MNERAPGLRGRERPERSGSTARDAGLRRVSGITRAALAAGLALTGAFSALAARAFAGHQTTAVSASTASASTAAPTASTTTTTTAPSSGSSAGNSSSASSSNDDSSLQPSYTTPRSSRGSAQVTSGGS